MSTCPGVGRGTGSSRIWSGPKVPAQEPVDGEIRTAQTHGVTVRLTGEAEVGETSAFTLAFTDTCTGQPVTGLQPYLGAAGHYRLWAQFRLADGTVITARFAVDADEHE
jgi:hypothetical protein